MNTQLDQALLSLVDKARRMAGFIVLSKIIDENKIYVDNVYKNDYTLIKYMCERIQLWIYQTE